MNENIPLELLADLQDVCESNGYIISSFNTIHFKSNPRQASALQLTLKAVAKPKKKEDPKQ